MRRLSGACVLLLALAACGGGGESTPDASHVPPADAGPDAASGCQAQVAQPKVPTCSATGASNIKHLVLVIQENHTFDNYFGKYCTAAPGSSPTCNNGPACCEKAPAMEASGASPTLLDDVELGKFDPVHLSACELGEINGGAMDRFVTGIDACSNTRNFAVADPAGPIAPYIAYAQAGAIADHYFQPTVGQSSSNDMYFGRAAYVFADNGANTNSVGSTCGFGGSNHQEFDDPTIGDLLKGCSVPWKWYAAGYAHMAAAVAQQMCPARETGCHVGLNGYPCMFDPTDCPFEYYPTVRDDPEHIVDLDAFATDVAGGTLPAVSFVKPIGFKTEHPGFGSNITEGTQAVAAVVDAIAGSAMYKDNTLVLITYDEGGGYYDHVPPPATNTIDCAPYGTRTILVAVGAFAKANYVSHVVMEHSSLIKFIEWNWFNKDTGHLGTRDTNVNNIGDLLDPAKTGVQVPSN